jgi:sugar lactone lactonase YvrE
LAITIRRMQKCLPCLVCALVVSQAHASDPLKVQNADSPDGKYILEAVATSDDACRVNVKTKPNGKVAAQFAVKDFNTDDRRYSISAVWKEDSAAFALNINKGPHITYCRVFVENHGSWKEVGLPEKQITKLRKESNTQGGKAVDYLLVTAWSPKDDVKFSYTGDAEVEFEMIGHLVRAERPRLDFVKIIPPKAEPEPKYDYENYVFTPLAGGTEGSKDGVGVAAQFKWPHGLSIDAAGNVFVADRGNDLVRKINRDGVVSTLAGSPEKYGDTDGVGAAARFRYPVATAVDASGNIYVADSSNNLIRKITRGGVVSTLAGSFSLGGFADGNGKAAQFHDPHGVAVDTSGDVFVADAGNHIIRKIASDGQVTTFAGSAGQQGMVDGEAKSARFAFPRDVALDREGNLYVADNSTLRKIDSHGMVSTVAGSPDQAINIDGPVGAARFSNPLSVAVSPAGNIYVVDDKNIRKITPGGVVKTIRDSTGRTSFVRPVSVAVDDKEQIYVADEDGFSILVGKPAK